jgi:hypothetical protein
MVAEKSGTCRDQRVKTWAGVFPWASAILTIVGSAKSLPLAKGQWPYKNLECKNLQYIHQLHIEIL